jgi:hypothetical protein
MSRKKPPAAAPPPPPSGDEPPHANGANGSNGHVNGGTTGKGEQKPQEPSNPATPVVRARVVGGWKENRPQAEWRPEDGFSPEAVTPTGHKISWRQCCAWKNGRKTRCTAQAVAGRDVCRSHGGAIGSGRPPIHGRYAGVLMGAVRDAYMRHCDSDEASDPTDELALMRAGVERAYSRASSGDTPRFRQEALSLWERGRTASIAGDAEAGSRAFRELGELLREGRNRDDSMRELFDMADKTAAAATNFRRVRVAEARVFTEAQLVAVLRMIGEEIRVHVPIEHAARLEAALDHRIALAAGVGISTRSS